MSLPTPFLFYAIIILRLRLCLEWLTDFVSFGQVNAQELGARQEAKALRERVWGSNSPPLPAGVRPACIITAWLVMVSTRVLKT